MPLAKPHHEVRVEYDQACIGCDYALRGLPVTGVCPECGMAIARSFRGDRLAASYPEYVATLLRGATFLLLAIVIPLLVFIATMAIAVFAPISAVDDRIWKTLILLHAIVTAGLAVAGVIRLTTSDPEGLGRSTQETGRMLARPGVMAAAAAGLTALALNLFVPASGIAVAIAVVIMSIGLLATGAGAALSIHAISRRSGERRLTKRLRNTIILLAIAVLLYLSSRLLGVVFGRGLAGLLLLVAVVYGLGVIEEVRAVLKRDASAARLRRAAHPVSPHDAPPTTPPTAPPATPTDPPATAPKDPASAVQPTGPPAGTKH